MTSRHIIKRFLDRLENPITFRPLKEEKEQLLKLAEKEGLLEATPTELMRAYFRANNDFGKKLECPYATWHSYDQIDCAKDFETKGAVYKLTEAFCSQCWERQQKKKLEDRTQQIEAIKAQIHRSQERVDQTIKQQREDIIICPNTDQVISKTQCNTCDPAQRKRCQGVMQDPAYQRELTKIKTLTG